jgi:hypothetical protein
VPIVVLAINVCDGRGSKFFGGDVFQASQIDPINSIYIGRVTNAERAHATVFTEIVFVAFGVEQVFG